MADPGTLAGIVSLGIQVTDSLVKYYTACKDRESDTAHTVKRLTHLSTILEILRKQLVDREFQPDEKSLLQAIERSVGDCEELIKELQQETEKFTKAPQAGVAAAARATGRRLAYPFRQSTLQKLDEDVDEICANLTLALQVLQQQDLCSVQDEIHDTKALLELVRASQVSSEIRDWLKAPDASVNYNDACKKKHPGTGLWFVKSPEFQAWLRTAGSFLWLNGFAGCGKSVLSSTIIQHTLRHRRSNPRIGIAFFYLTFTDESKQNTSAVLRALILQLVSQLEEMDTNLSRLYQSHCGAAPANQALVNCLHQLLGNFDQVYIILDALDESPRHKHREDLLQALEDMRRWPDPQLHLLVTSRDEQDIREHINPLPDQAVKMNNVSVDADIASFVSSHLKDNRRLRKWEKHRDLIERALTEGAKGVFRWVECQFSALEACPGSKTRLDALLKSLPRNLDKTYERMLLSIEEESAEDARRILTLLCTAKEPLSVSELIDGIAVELGDDPRFNENSRLMNEDDIRHICPGFIEVDVDRSHWIESTTVRIAHYSVQEYLQSDRILTGKTAKFGVKQVDANTEVALICVAYLMDRGWSHGTSVNIPKRPLAPYALRNWPEHYREGNGWDSGLHRLALQLFHDYQLGFITKRNLLGFWLKDDEIFATPLDLAASMGLDPIVRALADPSAAPLRPKNYLESAMVTAARYGWTPTMKLLLDHGADIDYLGTEGTALHLAAKKNHIKVVETLLIFGANMEIQDFGDLTPLYRAAQAGHHGVVQVLLDKGAKLKLTGAAETLLEVAAGSSSENVVALLLNRGEDPNVGGFQTPLEAASGAKVKGTVERWGVPTSNHKLAVMRLLISRGADVNFGKQQTPLERLCGVCRVVAHTAHTAHTSGCLLHTLWHQDVQNDMLRLLIDKGADVNRGKVRTPLETAAMKGNMVAAKILLNHRADPNLGIQMTPWQTATRKGYPKLARLLAYRVGRVDEESETARLEQARKGEREDSPEWDTSEEDEWNSSE